MASIAGIHLNYLLVQPDTQPETPGEREWKSVIECAQQKLNAYSHLQQTKPASLAYAAAPKSWVQKEYNLKHWTIAPKGGHFAAKEVPSYFVDNLRDWPGDLRA
ncbi:hypothetical protein [Burkholderia sp. THE68]|uniref:hypothetical protein n=1 Tax=Burkholderia sp. THE68 TaxID=758782 RepID=UPI00138A5C1C|nr:hypothetical protein [Burkholderia sp. THE68]